MTTEPRTPVLASMRPVFRAIAETVVPETASLDPPGWDRLENIVAQGLADRPARMHRQLLVFLRLVDLLPLLRHRRRFRSLPVTTRARVLRRLQDSPLLLLRRGFWGVRTLVYMGWYAQADTARRIGYRAAPGGWTARPNAVPSHPLQQVPPARDVGPIPASEV